MEGGVSILYRECGRMHSLAIGSRISMGLLSTATDIGGEGEANWRPWWGFRGNLYGRSHRLEFNDLWLLWVLALSIA